MYQSLKDEINELSNRLIQLESLTDPSKKDYFRFKSISNLLFHLSEIQDRSQQRVVIKCISEYLDDATQYTNSMNKDTSVDLYDKYLRDVFMYFDEKLGFTYFSLTPHIFLTLIFFGVFYVFVGFLSSFL